MSDASFRVEPSDLEREVRRVEAIADSLGHAMNELMGVQHAQNAADSPEVAAAIVAMVDAWGSSFANLTVFVGEMAEKLQSASSAYICTDAQAGNWMQFIGGAVVGVAGGSEPRH